MTIIKKVEYLSGDAGTSGLVQGDGRVVEGSGSGVINANIVVANDVAKGDVAGDAIIITEAVEAIDTGLGDDIVGHESAAVNFAGDNGLDNMRGAYNAVWKNHMDGKPLIKQWLKNAVGFWLTAQDGITGGSFGRCDAPLNTAVIDASRSSKVAPLIKVSSEAAYSGGLCRWKKTLFSNQFQIGVVDIDNNIAWVNADLEQRK